MGCCSRFGKSPRIFVPQAAWAGVLVTAMCIACSTAASAADDAVSAATKLPPPDEATLRRAVKVVQDVFSPVSERAMTPAAKVEIAKKVLAHAPSAESPAERFACHLVAREMALGAGDYEVALTRSIRWPATSGLTP